MIDDRELLDSRLRLARHAVRRGPQAKSVVQNLKTGTYHRLNPTALRMLNAVNTAPSVREAALAFPENTTESQPQLNGT
jgi:hypothetical protein